MYLILQHLTVKSNQFYAHSLVFKQNGSLDLFGIMDNKNDAKIFRDLANDMDYLEPQADVVTKKFKNLSKQSAAMAKKISEAGNDSTQAKVKFTEMAESLETVSIKAKMAEVGIKALNVAKNMLLSLGATLVISGVFKLIDQIANASKYAKEKAEEVSEAWNEQNESITSNIKTLNGLSSEFDKLSKGVDTYGNNINLASEDYERYKEIVSEVTEMSPSLITGYDEEGNAIANKNNLIEDSIKLQKEELAIERDKATSKDSLWTLAQGSNYNYTDIIRDFQSEKSKFQSELGGIFKLSNSNDKSSLDKRNFITGLLGVDESDFDARGNATVNFYKKIEDNIEKVYQQATANTDIFTKEDIAKFKEYVNEHKVLQDQLDKQGQSLNPTLQQLPKTLTAYDELNDAQKEFITNYINGFKITPDNINSQEAMDAMRQQILSFTQSIADDPDIQNNIDKLFSLDTSSMSYGELKSSSNAILDTIANSLGLQGEDKNEFIIKFGFDDKGIDSAIEELSSYGFSADRLNGLTEDEIKIMYSLDNVGDYTLDEAIDKVHQIQDESSKASIPSFETISKQVDDLQSAYSTLTSTVTEYNQNAGKLSIDTLQSLLALEPQYLACLQTENGQLVINQQSVYDLVDAMKASAIQKLQTAASTDLLALADGNVESLSWAAKTAIAGMGDAMGTAGETASLAAQGLYNFGAGVVAASGGKLDLSSLSAKQKTVLDMYKNCASSVANIGTNMNLVSDATSKASGAASSLSSNLSSAKSSIESLISSVVTLIKKDYSDQIEALNNAKKAAQDRYESEKDAAEDAWDAKEKIYDEEEDKLKEQLDAYKKIIDTKKESIQESKDNKDYQKELDGKLKEITEVENKISEISNDASAEGIKKRLELEKTLADKKSDLDDFQSDRQYNLTTDALDKEYSAYEEAQNAKIDALNKQKDSEKEIHDKRMDYLEEENQRNQEYYEDRINRLQEESSYEGLIRQQAMQQITDNIQNTDLQSNALYQKLLQWNRQYGTGIDSDIKNSWMNAQKAMQEYGNSQQDVYQTLSYLINEMNSLESSTSGVTSAMKDLASAVKSINDIDTSAIGGGVVNAAIKGLNLNTVGNVFKLRGYSSGGVITQTAPAMLHGSNNSPEVVFNASQASKLYEYVKNIPSMSSSGISGLLSKFSNNISKNSVGFNNSPKMECNIIVQGNANEGTVGSIKDAVKQEFKKFSDNLVKLNQQNGNMLLPSQF